VAEYNAVDHSSKDVMPVSVLSLWPGRMSSMVLHPADNIRSEDQRD
jgi:hypothetical protein